MDEQQQRVKAGWPATAWARPPGADAGPLLRVGELAKEVLKATGYGTRPLAPTASLEEELGDCLFSLLCVSEALGLDGEKALDQALEKYKARFAEAGDIGHRT